MNAQRQKFVLDLDRLLPGDILFSAEATSISMKVRKATDGDYSHVLLHVGGGSAIHADSRGVHSVNLQRMLFDEGHLVAVYRLAKANAEAMIGAAHFARSLVGTQYSLPEAVRSIRLRRTGAEQSTGKQFCSRLVAQSYAYVGLSLVSNPDYCYPEDILRSRLLVEIPSYLRLATDAEVTFALSDNPIDKQTEATNYVLMVARKLLGSNVQAMQDIQGELERTPQHDRALTNALVESGCLELWKGELEKNAWRYDGQQFLALHVSPKDKRELALKERSDALSELMRYRYMQTAYRVTIARAPLEFNKLQLQLYNDLCQLAEQRHAAALFVLQSE